MPTPKVLVITPDRLGPSMAGPAIRAAAIADAVSKQNETVLLSLNEASEQIISGAKVVTTNGKKWVKWADVVIYQGIVLEKDIPLISQCSHHHQTIMGVVHIAYIPGPEGNVVGLSKLNRIVDHFGRRGAIQEQLTAAIHQAVDKICEGNRGVIVTIVASHNCVSCRGVKHQGASMVTTKASGVFMDNANQARKEFFDSIKINNGGHQI